jgi:hypothetical protein
MRRTWTGARLWTIPSQLVKRATHWFPRRSCCQPAKACQCRPTPRSVRLDAELLEGRFGPTNMSPVAPGAALLASLVRPPEPLPALVQHTPSSDFVLPSPLREASGGELSLSWQTPKSVLQNSPSPLGGEGWGEGERVSTTPALMPWTYTAIAFSPNLNAIPSADSVMQAPLALDSQPAIRSHPPASLGGGAPEPHTPAADAASAGDYGGSGAPSLSPPQQNAFFLDASLPTQPNILLPPGALGNAPSAAPGAPVANAGTPAYPGSPTATGAATNLLLPQGLPVSSNNGQPVTHNGPPTTNNSDPSPDNPLIPICVAISDNGTVVNLATDCGLGIAPVINNCPS